MFEQRVSGCSAHRDGAVRHSSPPHGGHGGRLVLRRRRVGSSCRGSDVSQLAYFPGGDHRGSGPAAPLLVVSEKTSRWCSAVWKLCVSLSFLGLWQPHVHFTSSVVCEQTFHFVSVSCTSLFLLPVVKGPSNGKDVISPQ